MAARPQVESLSTALTCREENVIIACRAVPRARASAVTAMHSNCSNSFTLPHITARRTMKLYYFEGRGRAEPTRIMLHLAGVAFEDVRFSHAEWLATYQAKSPCGQCPWLELDDGTVLDQSLAIHVFCGDTAGYLPKDDPMQLARTVQLHAAFDDVRTK